MPAEVAIIVYALVILILFKFGDHGKVKASKAIWIPVAWTFIASSREVTQWFGGNVSANAMDIYLEGSPIDRSIYFGLICCSLIVLSGRDRYPGAILRSNWPIVVFFAYGLLSTLWSDFPFVAFKRWTKAVGNLLMVLVVLTERDRSAAIRQFFTYTAFLVIPLSVLLVKYFPGLGRQYNEWTGTAMFVGVSLTKNGLGWDCLVFGLALLWRVKDEWKLCGMSKLTKPLFAHGVVLVMAVWLLWLSRSSAALGGFLVGSIFIALSGKEWFFGRRPLVHLMAMSILAICVYGIIIDTEFGLVQAAGKDLTLTDRTIIWEELMTSDVNPVLGVGFESFWLGSRVDRLWEKYNWHPNQSHNGYIETYLTLGWVGVALLILKMLWGYNNAVTALRIDPTFSGLRLSLVIATIILNLTEATFKAIHPVWIVFLLVSAFVPVLAVAPVSDGILKQK